MTLLGFLIRNLLVIDATPKINTNINAFIQNRQLGGNKESKETLKMLDDSME
jgi:hypothetical protein